MRRLTVSLLRSDEAGLRGALDTEHLEFAAGSGLTLVTANSRDFIPLHWRWLEAGRHHAGLIIATQDLPLGERIRRLVELSLAAEPDDLRDELVILSQWA